MANLHMSEGEIVRNFKDARDKKSQILILADLNCCSKDTILDVLERNGEKVGWFRPKPAEQKAKMSESIKKSKSTEPKYEIPFVSKAVEDLDRIIESIHAPEIEIIEEEVTEPEPAPVTNKIPLSIINALLASVTEKETEINSLQNKADSINEQIERLRAENAEITEWIKKVEVA